MVPRLWSRAHTIAFMIYCVHLNLGERGCISNQRSSAGFQSPGFFSLFGRTLYSGVPKREYALVRRVGLFPHNLGWPASDQMREREGSRSLPLPSTDLWSRINDFIKTQQSENTVIFDSYELLLGENNKIDPQYSHDWLHLNKAGYEHLNQALTTFIK